MDELTFHRQRIDAIDVQLLQLLHQRALHAQQIGKANCSKRVYAPHREAEILCRVQALNPGLLPAAAVTRIFQEIISVCRALTQRLTIAMVDGCVDTTLATVQHFGHAVQLLRCQNSAEVIRVVEAGEADYGVVEGINPTVGREHRIEDFVLSSRFTLVYPASQ